jgi:hypothetical protein
MNRYLVLILGIAFAVMILRFRIPIKHILGDIGWADKIFGGGGTYSLLVVVAFFSFFGSLMYFFGTFQTIVSDYLGPLFGK